MSEPSRPNVAEYGAVADTLMYDGLPSDRRPQKDDSAVGRLPFDAQSRPSLFATHETGAYERYFKVESAPPSECVFVRRDATHLDASADVRRHARSARQAFGRSKGDDRELARWARRFAPLVERHR